MEKYKTVKNESSDEFVVKRSRFIGYVKPVSTAKEAMDFIGEIKMKHWDATHNVYAYNLRDGNQRRYSDDGEPQGTAGVPTLDVIIKEDVTDCVVVVTRYFGGVLLGAGGLVRAYSHGSKIALDSGKIITMSLCKILRVRADYNFYGKLLPIIESFDGSVTNADFGENVTVDFQIPVALVESFNKKLIDVSCGKVQSEIISEKYCEQSDS